MTNIRRLVLDVMKPFSPDVIEYAEQLTGLDCIEAINIALLETDREVENIKITIEGDKLDYPLIKEKINDLAGAIHSIDSVAAGSMTIEEIQTPQDNDN